MKESDDDKEGTLCQYLKELPIIPDPT